MPAWIMSHHHGGKNNSAILCFFYIPIHSGPILVKFLDILPRFSGSSGKFGSDATFMAGFGA
jgi:hypothetical protein